MTTKLTRRTALAGAVTLPAAMAPLGAMATAEIPQSDAATEDPFVAALSRYVEAEEAFSRSFDLPGARGPGGDAITAPYGDAADKARLAMAQTVPTTTLGLYLAIMALLPVFADQKPGNAGTAADLFDFDKMTVVDQWSNGSGEALLRSLCKGAERILNGNEEEV